MENWKLMNQGQDSEMPAFTKRDKSKGSFLAITVLPVFIALACFSTGLDAQTEREEPSQNEPNQNESNQDEPDQNESLLENWFSPDWTLYHSGFIRQLFCGYRRVSTDYIESQQKLQQYPTLEEKAIHLYTNKHGKYTEDITSVTTGRATLEASRQDWKVNLETDADFVNTNHPDSPVFPFFYKSPVRNRAMSMGFVHDEGDYLVRGRVHRLTVSHRTLNHDLTIGRQAISWGQGRFLNPMDLITPPGIFLQDMEDLPGADAISYTHYLNTMDSIQGVIVPMTRNDERNVEKLSSEDTTALVRYKGTYGNTDLVMLGGRHFRSWVLGVEAAAALWDAMFRFAWLGRREDSEFHDDPVARKISHQIVLGASYTFPGNVSTNLEVLYNSAHHDGEPQLRQYQEHDAQVKAGLRDPYDKDLVFFRVNGRIITRNPYIIQASVGGEIIDSVRVSLFLIGDPEGGSLLYGPQLQWSVSDEGVFIAGARLYGYREDNERAEFAEGNPLGFMLFRYHL